MPSRRSDIEMSMDEIRAYLRDQERLILVSNGHNGFPHPMPMNFLFDDQDRYVVTTFRKSQKVKNIERDPRCALLVESGSAYSELKSVLAYADAEVVDVPEETAKVMAALALKEARRGGMELSDDAKAQAIASAPKRVIIRYKPAEYISWDHTKLGGKY